MRGSVRACLGKHRIDAGFKPRLTWLNPEVMSLRLDANAPALEAADTRAFVRMGPRQAAGRKVHPVASHQIIEARLQTRLRLKREPGLHVVAGRSRFRLAMGQFPPQQS